MMLSQAEGPSLPANSPLLGRHLADKEQRE